MADLALMTTQLTDRMATVDGITVYDGLVPREVPEIDGKILPYVVLWAGLPDPGTEVTADGVQPMDATVWDFQATAVASNPAACRAVAHALQLALANLRLGTGKVRPNPEAFRQDVPLLDTSVTPARHMLPTFWRLHTN